MGFGRGRGRLAARRGDLEVAGAVGFGELANFDEALGYGARGGLFAGRGCDERGAEVSGVIVVGGEWDMGGGGTPCCGDALGVDSQLVVGLENFEQELV